MHQQHPLFPPVEGSLKIWRYIDLWKFEDLLKTRALYFTSGDHLQPFDKFEGMPTKQEKDLINSLIGVNFYNYLKKQKIKTLNGYLLRNDRHIDLRHFRKRFSDYYSYLISRTYISCWQICNYENYTMRNSYIPKTANGNINGVAIQTTVDKLLQSFNEANEVINAAQIRYVDLDTHQAESLLWNGGTYSLVQDMLFKKAPYFSNENELRLLTDDLSDTERFECGIFGGYLDLTKNNPLQGKHVSINLDTLIEKIYLPPSPTPTLEDEIAQILERHGCGHSLDSRVITSSALTPEGGISSPRISREDWFF